MRSFLTVVALAILTSGCAVGVKHDYNYADANWKVETEKTVAVAVHDQRSYIVDTNKTPDFVGLSRGGFGNPFDIVTASGRPLAADMTASLITGFRASNVQATAVSVSADKNPTQARKLVTASGAARALLVTLLEWKSDSYANTRLLYDLRAQVFDAEGTELAKTEIRGTDSLGASKLTPSSTAATMIIPAYKERLGRIFQNKSIQDALR